MLVHLNVGGERRWAVRRPGARLAVLPCPLAELLALPLAEARRVVEAAAAGPVQAGAAADGPAQAEAAARVLPPVDVQEVWAAGVTYQRSREGRREEAHAGHAGLYDAVYAAPRPELFLKATAARVVGDGDEVGIRADSGWDVPEPELGLVVNQAGEVFGYTVGNDVSSRTIEGENPLYLPQAKLYERSCALGPGIVPVWQAGPGPFEIDLRVERDGQAVFAGTTSTARLARGFDELVGWLTRALDFPAGVVLLTGTGVVPGPQFTLAAGDAVTIDVAGVGRLRNRVRVVGTGQAPTV